MDRCCYGPYITIHNHTLQSITVPLEPLMWFLQVNNKLETSFTQHHPLVTWYATHGQGWHIPDSLIPCLLKSQILSAKVNRRDDDFCEINSQFRPEPDRSLPACCRAQCKSPRKYENCSGCSVLAAAVCGLLQNCSILLDLMFVTLHCYWSLGCGVRWILTRMVQSGLNKLHEFAPHI